MKRKCSKKSGNFKVHFMGLGTREDNVIYAKTFAAAEDIIDFHTDADHERGFSQRYASITDIRNGDVYDREEDDKWTISKQPKSKKKRILKKFGRLDNKKESSEQYKES